MAKKKNNKLTKISLNGLILTVFGASMLLLALLPATSATVNSVLGSTKEITSFWAVLTSIFENGFGEGASLTLNICVLAYLVLGVLAMVFGILGLLKVFNTEKLSVLFYILTFVALLIYMIVFLANKESLVIGSLVSATVSTLVYIPLGVSALFTGYGIYKMLK